MLFFINEEAIMTNYFRQLKVKIQDDYFKFKFMIFLVSLIFLTNLFFVQTGLSQSLDSTEEHQEIEVFVVDELQAEDLIGQLSSYDHVTVEKLSDQQAQKLLDQTSYKNLAYSSYIGYDDFKLFSQLSCGFGSSFALGFFSLNLVESVSNAGVGRISPKTAALSIVLIPASLAAGCMLGLVVSSSVIGTVGVFSSIFDKVFPDEKAAKD